MLKSSNLFILISCFVLVQCEIPNLNVRKLDRQLIAKKRQDTLDMCRIFTEETAKIKQYKPKIVESYKNIRISLNNRRHKRDADTFDHGPLYKRVHQLKPKEKTRRKREVHTKNKLEKNLNNKRLKREADFSNQGPIFQRSYKFNPKKMTWKNKEVPNKNNLQKTLNNKRHKREANFFEHGSIFQKSLKLKPKEKTRRKREVQIKSNLEKAFDIFKKEGGKTYPVNPTLTANDVKKIESIVEKMYDEMEVNGEKIEYKRNPDVTSTTTSTTTTTMKPANVTVKTPSRRLYFAPKLLLGPGREDHHTRQNETQIYVKARWTHGIIPFFIDSKTYDAQLQETIMQAFDYIEKATCIRLQKLRERPTDRRSLQDVDWVYISNPSGVRQCVHSNEKRKIDGVQMSVLGYDCMSLGDIVHEVMHILGFSHEHSRTDRDQHISIMWDNIKPGYKKYFEIAKVADQYVLENLPYDYASILHYPPRAFSKNGQVTIMTEPGIKIGQRDGLSEIDLEKIGSIYGSECVERNKDYLLKTCPSVVKADVEPPKVSQNDIEDYFKDRLWPFGLINYKLRDQMEFSIEERENIRAVIAHIEKETCLQFRDISNEHDQPKEEDLDENMPNEDDNEGLTTQSSNVKLIDILGPERAGHIEENNLRRNAAENEINHADDLKNKATGLNQKTNSTRVRRQARPLPSHRRHANSILILTRSALPGCKCPQAGKPSGNAVLEINADCFNSVNDLLHLFVHVLGLDHQHNMHDRDNYLHIVWDKLTPEIKEELKEKLPPAASAGFPYDYQSVMHYPWLQIKNGVTNMMYPIWNDGWAMGHWQGLSSIDVQKLNLLYFAQCAERQKQSNSLK